MRELAAICPDEQIARHLNRLGHRTGKGNSWTRSRVCSLRASRRIPAFDPGTRTSWLSLSEAADRLGVSQATVRRFIVKGVLPAKQAAPGTPWIVQPEDVERENVTAAATAVRGGREAPPSASGQTQLPFE